MNSNGSKKFNLERFRKKTLGLTRAELAEVLGTSRNTVQRWESKKHSPPKYLEFAIRWLNEHGLEG